MKLLIVNKLENYQAVLWKILQKGKLLPETTTHSFTVKYLTYQLQKRLQKSTKAINFKEELSFLQTCQPFRWATYFDKLKTKDSHIS